jgi:hypothetical protein
MQHASLLGLPRESAVLGVGGSGSTRECFCQRAGSFRQLLECPHTPLTLWPREALNGIPQCPTESRASVSNLRTLAIRLRSIAICCLIRDLGSFGGSAGRSGSYEPIKIRRSDPDTPRANANRRQGASIDPVADRLLVDLEKVCDLEDGEERVLIDHDRIEAKAANETSV